MTGQGQMERMERYNRTVEGSKEYNWQCVRVFTRNAVLSLCLSALRDGTPSWERWNSAPGLFVLLRFCRESEYQRRA